MGRLARFIRFYTEEDDGNGGDKGVLKTVTGALIHITDALAKPLKKLVVNLEPVQSGSGDPSPENVRLITGHTGVNVFAIGKNLFDVSTEFKYGTNTNYNKNAGAALSIANSSSAVTVSGTNPVQITNTTNWRGIVFITKPLKAGVAYTTKYRLTGSNNTNIKRTRYLIDSNNVVVSRIGVDSKVEQDVDYIYTNTVTPTEDNLRYAFAIESSSQQTISVYDLALVSSEDDAYEPYNGTTIPIDFATSGENLYDASTVTTGYYIAANGTVSSAADSCYSDYISVTAGETYTWSGVQTESTNNNKRVHAYADGVWQSQITYEGIDQTGEFAITFQVPSGANQIRVSEFLSDTNVQVKHRMGESIYGGTLTYEDGEWTLVVTDAEVDLGTISWTAHATLANVFTGEGSTIPHWKYIRAGVVADAICSAYKLTTSAQGGVDAIDYSIALGTDSSTKIYVHDSSVADISEFRTVISGVQLVYELATPVTYTLTEEQALTLLQGENNIWADASDSIELTYYADGNVSENANP